MRNKNEFKNIVGGDPLNYFLCLYCVFGIRTKFRIFLLLHGLFFFFFFFILKVIFIELLFVPFNETFFIDSILDDFIFLKVCKL
jgi:hypothetical protein